LWRLHVVECAVLRASRNARNPRRNPRPPAGSDGAGHGLIREALNTMNVAPTTITEAILRERLELILEWYKGMISGVNIG
jgi:hypothetical protein